MTHVAQCGRIVRAAAESPLPPPPDRPGPPPCRSELRDDRAASLSGERRPAPDGPLQRRIQLARHNDAFETSPYGNDMYISCRHHVRQLFRRAKRQKPDVGNAAAAALPVDARFAPSPINTNPVSSLRRISRGFEKCVPGAVEAEISGVQRDEGKSDSEFPGRWDRSAQA